MTDWVPGDWGTIKAGDLICVVWPTGNREGKVFDAGAGTLYLGHPNGSNVFAVESLRSDGGALFVPVPTQPELPTVPGFYTDKERDLWILNNAGEWECVATPFLDGNPRGFAPFTRLLPQAETAKRFLQAVEEKVADNPFGSLGALSAVRAVATEFGVSLD